MVDSRAVGPALDAVLDDKGDMDSTWSASSEEGPVTREKTTVVRNAALVGFRVAMPGSVLLPPLAGAAGALVLALCAQGLHAQAAATPDALLKQFLAAVQAHSYDDMVAPFVAQGGEIAAGVAAQKAAAMAELDTLNRVLGPQLAQGYTAVAMGTLKFRNLEVHLWKLVYKSGVDDDLAYAVLRKDGKARGFGVRPLSFLPVVQETVADWVPSRDARPRLTADAGASCPLESGCYRLRSTGRKSSVRAGHLPVWQRYRRSHRGSASHPDARLP